MGVQDSVQDSGHPCVSYSDPACNDGSSLLFLMLPPTAEVMVLKWPPPLLNQFAWESRDSAMKNAQSEDQNGVGSSRGHYVRRIAPFSNILPTLAVFGLWSGALLASLPISATEVDVDLFPYGTPGDLASGTSIPRIGSQDGRYIFHLSSAPDLVPGCSDLNNGNDVFVFDRVNNANRLLTHSALTLTATGNGASSIAAISSDARWVLVGSLATDLVAGLSDINLANDVFLIDQTKQTTTLVSRSALGLGGTANGASTPIAMSADGQWIVFSSTATDLVSGVVDNNNGNDAYLYDRISGNISLVSRSLAPAPTTGIWESKAQGISGDGRWVVFQSRATDLVAGMAAPTSALNVFAFDRVSGSTQLVSRTQGGPTTPTNGDSSTAGISQDGRFVVLNTFATNWFAGISDTNNTSDVVLFDRSTQTTTLLSHAFDNPSQAVDGQSFAYKMSPDGRWILLSNHSSNILGEQTTDVLVFDRQEALFIPVTPLFTYPISAKDFAYPATISDDGRWIAYYRGSARFLPGVTDTNNETDAFLFDRINRVTLLVSHAADDESKTANHYSVPIGSISADGRWLSFFSRATNLIAGVRDNNLSPDSFLFDRVTRTSKPISRSVGIMHPMATNGQSYGAGISADGRWALYGSDGTNIDLGSLSFLPGGREVFLYDAVTRRSELISHTAGLPNSGALGASHPSSISQDGRWILFESNAQNIVPNTTDTNATTDAFLRDRENGVTELLSPTFGNPWNTANRATSATRTSLDGRWVLMSSKATDLVAGVSDSNGSDDVFLRDRQSSTTILVSRAFGSPTLAANGLSSPYGMSEDGRWILYVSSATNLIDGVTYLNSASNVFLFDAKTGSTTLVSHSVTPFTGPNNISFRPRMSADGRWVTFSSLATDLVSDATDSNNAEDVFLFDRLDASIILVSRSAVSSASTGNGSSDSPQISSDGCCIAFSSLATDLKAGLVDSNNAHDAYVFDRNDLSVTLLSRTADSWSVTANGDSGVQAISNDGRFAILGTDASDISDVAGDNGQDTYLVEVDNGATTLLSRRIGPPSEIPNASHFLAATSPDAQFLLLNSTRPNLVEGVVDTNGKVDVFLIRLSLFGDGFE